MTKQDLKKLIKEVMDETPEISNPKSYDLWNDDLPSAELSFLVVTEMDYEGQFCSSFKTFDEAKRYHLAVGNERTKRSLGIWKVEKRLA